MSASTIARVSRALHRALEPDRKALRACDVKSFIAKRVKRHFGHF